MSEAIPIRRIRDIRPDDIDPERVWRHVWIPPMEDDCWPWLGSVSRGGYGRVSMYPQVKGGPIAAHRATYILTFGPIPLHLVLDHLCGNKLCVNPLHLEAVTPRENTHRGNKTAVRLAARTECDNGHPLSGDNLAIRTCGSRKCRQCHADYMRAWNRRAKS